MSAVAVSVTAPQGLAPPVRPLDGLRQTLSLSWRTLVQVKHNPVGLMVSGPAGRPAVESLL